MPGCDEAIIIIDVWDVHWNESLNKKTPILARRINKYLNIKRRKKVSIIHAPAQCMDYYAWWMARINALKHKDKECKDYDPADFFNVKIPAGRSAHTRQHDAIYIAEEDCVADEPCIIFNILKEEKINTVYLVGEALDVCIMNRPYGAVGLKHAGYNPVIVAELTESMVIDKKTAIKKIKKKGYEVV